MEPSQSIGIMLGCWDQDKTSSLIKELEQTVSFAEQKCGDLVQQLDFYRKYYEKWSKTDSKMSLIAPKKKMRKRKKGLHSVHSSETNTKNDVADAEKVNQIFYEKLKSKIDEVNDEITQANHKIGLTETSFLFPTDEFKETLHASTASTLIKVSPSQLLLTDEEYPNKWSKSDPVIGNQMYEDAAKITKGELELYKKLSNKSIKMTKNKPQKPRSKSVPQKIERKFGLKSLLPKKTVANNVSEPKSKTTIRSSCSSSKSRLKTKSVEKVQKPSFKIKRPVSKSARSASSKNSIIVRRKSSVLEENKSGLMHSKSSGQMEVEDGGFNQHQKPGDAQQKKPIPFTICTSTTRSFNIGMNIQQAFSLMKRKKLKNTVDPKEPTQENSSSPTELVVKLPVSVSETVAGNKPRNALTCVKSSLGPVPLEEFAEPKFDGCGDVVRDRGKPKQELSLQNGLLSWHRKLSSLHEKLVHNNLSPSQVRAELDCMESELTAKESECKNFIDFYAELMSLKEKLASLREINVTSTAPAQPQRRKSGQVRTTPAMALSKVLRQIQSLH